MTLQQHPEATSHEASEVVYRALEARDTPNGDNESLRPSAIESPRVDDATTKTKRSRRRTRRGATIGRLPAGSWRVRWYDETDARRGRTFPTYEQADNFAATIKADKLRGEWRDPNAGAVRLADYARRWLETTDHRPSTRALYDHLLRRYLEPDLEFRPTTGHARTVNIGVRHLNKITTDDVREWLAAVRVRAEAAALDKAERHAVRDGAHRRRAARAWAIREGRKVATSGRLPAGILEEWEAAGRPTAVGTYSDDTRSDRRDPGATTARQAYQLLRAVLAAAVADRRILANPCQIKGAGQARTPELIIPTAEQVEAIADAIDPRLRAAVLLAAYSGLRPGEVFALARRHIDLTAATVRVERTLDARRLTFGPPKTDAGRRTVHLPASVVDELRAHLTTYVGRRGDALLFTTTTGGPVPPSRRTVLLSSARAIVGCTEVTWHGLRHYAATSAAQKGATTRELQTRIGHSTPAAAMRYQHATAERDQAIATALDDLRPTPPPANVIPFRRKRTA